jgi:leucine dehydrogenase
LVAVPGLPLGVFTAFQVAYQYCSGAESLAGCRVLIQGVSSVGHHLIDRLLAAGAEVLFSEVNPALISRYQAELGLQFVPPERVPETACDIYAPCPLGGMLNEQTIPFAAVPGHRRRGQ